MKEIILGGKKGFVALVDDDDFDRVSSLWCVPNVSRMANGSISTVYAIHYSLLMHRFILNPSKDLKLDHIDRNGLNNRKSNLRVGTHSQNLANRPKSVINTSGYKGVYRTSNGKRWFSIISFANKNRHLGTFESKEEAARAYDQAAVSQCGQFAFTNFPTHHP